MKIYAYLCLSAYALVPLVLQHFFNCKIKEFICYNLFIYMPMENVIRRNKPCLPCGCKRIGIRVRKPVFHPAKEHLLQCKRTALESTLLVFLFAGTEKVVSD